jgi:predicted glutamine amidotransferase
MCRVLAYSGPPVVLEDLLFKPDSSLIRQAYAPRQLHKLNLGGFGMLAWDDASADPDLPWDYRSTDLPVFDGNLHAMARKAQASCLLAHVRGIPYRVNSGFGAHNLHPFRFPGSRWAMAHNGDLYAHDRLKPDLLQYLSPTVLTNLRGTTDSETVYAMVTSLLGNRADDASPDELLQALCECLQLLGNARRKLGIDRNSALNLFFSDGQSILALRYTFDFGCYDTDRPASVHESNLGYLSLWYTVGERYQVHKNEFRMAGRADQYGAFLLASEPLTRDTTGWVEVPEYTALMVTGEGDDRHILTADIDV